MYTRRFALLNKLTDLYERSCKPICQKLKLPHSAFSILMFLNNYPEHYTAKDISKFLSMKPSIVSVHVEKLVLMGYLDRLPIPEDRRQVRLICTQKAADLLAKGRQTQEELFASLTAGFSPEDVSQFMKYLDTLADNAASFQSNLKL